MEDQIENFLAASNEYDNSRTNWSEAKNVAYLAGKVAEEAHEKLINTKTELRKVFSEQDQSSILATFEGKKYSISFIDGEIFSTELNLSFDL